MKTSDASSAISLTGEAGKVYCLRAEVEERLEHQSEVKLEPIDGAKGQLLIASVAQQFSSQELSLQSSTQVTLLILHSRSFA